jgi:23S rRNA (uracil1939-C5)-methyltransferase
VEVRIDEDRKDYSTATVTKVLEPSPDRVSPPCVYFGRCGGCHLQFISYPHQIKLKEEVLKGSLRRIAKLDVQLSDPLSGEPWLYRHRAQFKVAGEKVGFFREKSRDVVDIESCPLMAHGINEGLKKTRGILAGMDIKELHLACNDGTVALVKTRGASKAGWNSIADAFLRSGFSGLVVELENKRLFNYGQGSLAFDLLGLEYTVSPASFFQGHWSLNQTVVRFLCDALQPLEGKIVLDLYAGAGNFSLPLAMHAASVTAVEENPGAVEDGKRNLKLNGIKNCRFIRSNVDSLRISEPVDILVVDPPRQGIGDFAIGRIFDIAPERVAYISCDPASFSRDIKKLIERYEVESVCMIDFFPQTYHIESMAFLRLRSR